MEIVELRANVGYLQVIEKVRKTVLEKDLGKSKPFNRLRGLFIIFVTMLIIELIMKVIMMRMAIAMIAWTGIITASQRNIKPRT